MSDDTVRAYESRVNHFLVFISTSAGKNRNVLTNQFLLDDAVREYQSYMRKYLKATPGSVANAFTALDHFFEFLGLDKCKIQCRDDSFRQVTAMTPIEYEQFRFALQTTSSVLDRAVVSLLIYTGITADECALLDMEDVMVTTLSGSMTVRGATGCPVALPAQSRLALAAWLDQRARYVRWQDQKAFFVDLLGMRLHAVNVDLAVRRIGRQAGLNVSAATITATASAGPLFSGSGPMPCGR